MLSTVKFTLAADWTAGNSITVGYAQGVDGGYLSSGDHKISVKNGGNLVQGRDFAVTIGKASASIALAAGMATIPAGSELFVEFHLKGDRRDIDLNTLGVAGRISRRQMAEINFGAAAAAVTNGVAASQALLAATAAGANINGSLLVSGQGAVFDVPRNVVAAWTGTAVLTVTGYDEFGNLMVESSASGTSLTGSKAFKRITKVTTSADVTGLTVGSGVKLGLPVYLPNSVFVIKETEDFASATAGTTVAGVLTKPTATTGDVRGTYTPNSTPDGSKKFSIFVALDDPTYLGSPQFAG